MAAEIIVIVTDRCLFPCREGHQARIIELIRALRANGMRVVLVGPRMPWRILPQLPGPRYSVMTRLLVDRFVPVDGGRFASGSPSAFDFAPYAAAVEAAVTRHRPVAVIAEYLWMAPCLDVVNHGTLRLLDTLDVMHVRRQMYAAQPEGAWVECSREEESALLARADVVIAIQPHEQQLFGEMVPQRRVICVPHPVRVRSGRARKPAGEVVAFVGSRIQGNLVGIESFIEAAWPAVRRSVPAAELRIYGGVVERLSVNAPGVVPLGRIRRLARAYAAARVVINPVTLGTGLKIKTVEALAHGKAVVTTSCGASGLEEAAGRAFLVEDDRVGFGRAVTELLLDEGRRRAFEREARRLALERFGPDTVLSSLLSILREPHRPARAETSAN